MEEDYIFLTVIMHLYPIYQSQGILYTVMEEDYIFLTVIMHLYPIHPLQGMLQFMEEDYI
jgi:hypothetical protein